MDDKEYKKAYSVYNQVFGTQSGMEVLADLKHNFYEPTVLNHEQLSAKLGIEFAVGARYVIQCIFDKMKIADKRQFADIMREIELIEPIGKEM